MTLSEQFHRHFAVQLATDTEQRLSAYRLRYRVYCEEFGYLEPRTRSVADYNSRIERDEFDSRATICLVTHRHTGRLAGCARVVTAPAGLYETPLPMEKHCLEALSLAALEQLSAERDRVGEVSRLCVDHSFRRRGTDSGRQFGNTGAVDINKGVVPGSPMIALAAVLGAVAVSEGAGVDRLFAMMNPALLRLMRRSGVAIPQVGHSTDYHGKRAPHQIDIASTRGNVAIPALLAFYDVLRNELSGSLESAVSANVG